MIKSAYIHIPFCKQKCKYCSFVSFTNIDKINIYIDSLIEDINSNYKGEALNTLYFGGGTPSLLDIEFLSKIINIFKLNTDCEVTLEMNPDDASLDYLQSLFDIGINRISIGSQTFDDNVLNLIGRRHNSKQVFNAIRFADKAGFKNISLDLIYGLPFVNLKNDLEIISDLGIKHVSTYGLKIEENSYWGKFPPQNIPNDDEQADMYTMINDFLGKKGYKRYEISNFAIPGYESRHNLNYWNNNEYYGFGLASHGYVDGTRYSKSQIFDKYINNPTNFENKQVLTIQEKLEEEIFLGFRKAEGLDINKIQEKYGIDFNAKYNSILNKFMPDYIEKTKSGYKLTLNGVLLSNNILAEFID